MKCYVCKYVNSVMEATTHPNPTTIGTARLLHQRVIRHNRDEREDHLCDYHLTQTGYSNSMDTAGKAMHKLTTPKRKEEK